MSIPKGRLTPPPPAAIAQALNIDHLTVDWLAGDGSDRCYFRVRSPELAVSYVLMQLSGNDAENLSKGRYDWVDISEILRANKIAAPRCVAALKEHAAILIEDYGDLMLETVALGAHKDGNMLKSMPLFKKSLAVVACFLNIKATPGAVWTKRQFDRERFAWELRFFVTKYLSPIARYQFSASELSEFNNDIDALSSFLGGRSEYFVHRDFHSRNIMVLDQEVAVIDFQDARLGPPSYDLVSLVFDSYVPLSPEARVELLNEGFEMIAKTSGVKAANEARDEWRPMLLQRQLKAIGSFGFLTVDKQRGDYLKNVAPALQTLLDAGVQDARWPFLSGKLIQILAKSLPDRTHLRQQMDAPLKLAGRRSSGT
jgi:aminoglycoside/choline kinase family phosphotransferase